MKHLRKIGILIIAVVMAAAIAVGICVIYAVRNVNVTYLSYGDDESSSAAEISAIKESVMTKVRGRVISSVGEEDVAACLDDDLYLETFEKVFPCTLNVTVRQRREVFAVFNGENYSTYDDSGKFMRVADNSLNSFDGAPNLVLEGVDGEADINEVAAICAIFKSDDNFGSLRSAVEKVTLYKAQSSISTDKDKITFSLWCGLSIEIQDYPRYSAEKISKAYKKFCDLSPEDKLRGKINSRISEEGKLIADYNPNV